MNGPVHARWGAWLGVLLAAAGTARASVPDPSAADVEFFEARIRPLLVESCYPCHSQGAGKSKGGLRLDTRDAVRHGGDAGPALVAGDPGASRLIQAVRYADPDLQMPPADDRGRLSAEQVALLEEWVRRGAPDPRSGGPAHPLDMPAARRHWAFQPVVKPEFPADADPAWGRTPVDAFISAGLRRRGLAPAPDAEARTLLRRVTYDLTGLPPTPEEMDAFLAEHARGGEAAYRTVVDRLLASPRHGERWGRFWLDVARFADTRGYLAGNAERRYPFSHTYRDYVIAAFNADLPYDRFIREQLAADLLPPGGDRSALAALGFLTLGRRFLNNQNDIIDDRIDVVTRGLQGLTVTCARCHDHKFDPVPTRDYYSLHGIFASSEEPAELPLLRPIDEQAPAYQEYLRKKAAAEARVRDRAQQEVDGFLAGLRQKPGAYLLGAVEASRPGRTGTIELFAGSRKLNPEVLKRTIGWLPGQGGAAHPVLGAWTVLAAIPAETFAAQASERVAAWSGPGGAPGWNPRVVAALAKAKLTALGDVAAAYDALGAAVEKAWREARQAAGKAGQPAPDRLEDDALEQVRQIVAAADAPANLSSEAAAAMIKRQIDDKTSGLRREVEALNWTEPGAPLRAMALVDKAVPRNSSVFLRGNPANKGPEAPRRYLEVLASVERPLFTRGSGRLELAAAITRSDNPLTARVFVNRVWGWHFGTPLVRTPSDFGVRTEVPAQAELLDWLAASFVEGGWSVKRLHREIVLSRAYRQAGEPGAAARAADPENALWHHFPRRRLELEALRDTLLAVSGVLDPTPGGLPDDLMRQPFTARRTVYGFIDRQDLPGMFRTFDYPNPDVSTAQRLATTVPQQALFLLNSPFVQEQARRLAARPEVAGGAGPGERVGALYRLVYQREPDADELALAVAFASRPPGPPAEEGPIWSYGLGTYDPASGRLVGFAPLTVRKEGRLSPGEAYPEADFGHLQLSATGGHPGRTSAQAVVRRWTAPGSGEIAIEGALGRAAEAGDGVRGRVISSRGGRLGEWTVRTGKVEARVAPRRVEAGETIDFVVDALDSPDSDAFTWAPVVDFLGDGAAPSRTYAAKRDFESPPQPPEPLSRWAELAQVLLMANELSFID